MEMSGTKTTNTRQKNCRKHVQFAFFVVCIFWFVVSGDIFYSLEISIGRQIWASSKPSPLIGRELILVESPQEGAETGHFLLELRA